MTYERPDPRPTVPSARCARRWPMILPLLAASLLMASCRHGTPRTPAPPPELLALVATTAEVPEELLMPCPETIPPTESGDLLHLGVNHVLAARMYHECAAANWRLIEAVRTKRGLDEERRERARRALESR